MIEQPAGSECLIAAKACDISEFRNKELYRSRSSPNSSPSFEPIISRSRSASKNPAIPFEKKRVLTPDWECRKEDEQIVCNIKNNEDFEKIADLHHEIEVIERRIEYGLDKDHQHPGLAASIHNISGVTGVSRREKKLRDNYTHIVPVSMRPIFWPDRVWDSKEFLMTEEQTKLLKEKIISSNANPDSSSQIVTRQRSWSTLNMSKRESPYHFAKDEEEEYFEDPIVTQYMISIDEIGYRKRGRPPKYNQNTRNSHETQGSIIVLPTLCYETDLSMDETEYQDEL